jgi:photosystem II stability/assembly factor-like uncharacterized protein
MNITCITQNPLNPDEIYYGTGEHKNRKIRDLGSGIYKSSDHGITFSRLPATANSSFILLNTIKHSKTDSATFFVGTTQYGLYRSADGGNSFETVFAIGKKIHDIECFTNGKVMITANGDGIYYSATGDSGTFIKSTGTPASGFGRIEIAYCDSFPDIIYATFADSVQSMTTGLEGAYKSTDGGMSWFAITNPDNVGFYCYADYMQSLAVKPDDPDFVVTGGAQSCYTTNGGQSYTDLQYPWIDQHAFVFSKFNNDLLYIGMDQGVTSFDFSQSPFVRTDLISHYNTVQIWAGTYAPTGNNFLIGSQDNVFYRNVNQDSTFLRINSYGSDGKNVHIHQQQPSTAYACGDFADLYKTGNLTAAPPVFTSILNELDGDGDGLVDDDVWHENQFEMNYLDGEQLYLPTRDYVWRSVNGGDNWEKITNSYAGGNNSPHPYAIGLSNDVFPTVYTGGTKGLFVRIDDAFNAVQGQEADLSDFSPAELVPKGKLTCLTVHPLDDYTVYATVLNTDSVSRVWKITNANDTSLIAWNDLTGNLSRRLNTYWIEPDPDHPDSVLFIGTDYGLWYTTDAGTSWFREPNIPPITIYQMRMRKSDRKLFVYTFGRGIWIVTLPGNTSGAGVQQAEGGVSVYPNPATDLCTVRWQGDAAEVSVADAHGRIVYTESKPVNNQLHLDLKHVERGVYFVRVSTRQGDFTAKLVRY